MISMDKIYRTRDGRKVRVLATDIKSPTPVIAVVSSPSGVVDVVFGFTADGCNRSAEQEHPLDLIEYNPAQDLVLDQPIWVFDKYTGEGTWEPRHFAGLSPDGTVLCFADGKTSHTTVCWDCPVDWKRWTATKPEGTV